MARPEKPGARVGEDVAASGRSAAHSLVLFGKGKKGFVKIWPCVAESHQVRRGSKTEVFVRPARPICPQQQTLSCCPAKSVSSLWASYKMKRGRQLTRPLPIPGVNWSILETLIAAPPPCIAGSRTVSSYHFGAFDVVMGKRLCTLNRRHSGPCRGRAVAGRGGESIATVYWCIARGCN
jgi:hypothetical protein